MSKENQTLILEVKRLSKSFGDVKALNELNLSLQEGEVLALLGPNGAGKTVSINIICGLNKPDSGEVFYRGRLLNRQDRGIFGICPQNVEIWPKQTCVEQLVFIGRMYDLSPTTCVKQANYLIDAMQLDEKRHKLAETLSGGMKRRLNLALGLMHDPQILILDEYEVGLDPQSRVMVREFVLDWVRSPRRSILLTTHNMDEADRMADRVAIIDHGSLLVADTPEILKKKVGLGDILEIELIDRDNRISEALEAIRSICENTNIQNGTLTIRTLEAVKKLPGIIQALDLHGVNHGEVTLRGNTLEDVFISLTGRALRP